MDSENLNLIVIQTRDIGPGFQLANRAGALNCEILELSILGKGILLILNTQEQDPEQVRQKLSDRDATITTHKELPMKVFNAYLSTEQGKLGSDLVIFEGTNLGHLFEVCQRLPTAEIIDLRMIRGAQAKAYLFLSGVNADALSEFRSQHLMVTHLGPLTEEVRAYLEISPTTT